MTEQGAGRSGADQLGSKAPTAPAESRAGADRFEERPGGRGVGSHGQTAPGEGQGALQGQAGPALSIDAERLRTRFDRIARIGALPAGGCHRLAFSSEERDAHAEFARQARRAGLSVYQDHFGNTFARLEPRMCSRESAATTVSAPRRQDAAGERGEPGAGAATATPSGPISSEPAVLTGSHLDTVAQGGCYDGAAGVICSLEAVVTLAEAQARGEIALARPIEVVVWANEEGGRFAPAMMGSAVYARSMTLDQAYGGADADGVTVREALAERAPIRNGRVKPYRPDTTPELAGYLELHIEQGVELERAGLSLAVVEGVQAQIAGDWTITGRSAHAGATPMHRRSDALSAASRLVARTPEIAAAHKPGVATVGFLRVLPGSRNSVPGSVEGTIDIRHPEEEAVEAMHREFVETGRRESRAEAGAYQAAAAVGHADPGAGHEAGGSGGCTFSFRELWRSPQVKFAPAVVSTLERAAGEAGVGTMRLYSAAGHDAVKLAQLCPSGMLFVPSRDGVSHHPEEFTEMSALADGANVLARALLELAGE